MHIQCKLNAVVNTKCIHEFPTISLKLAFNGGGTKGKCELALILVVRDSAYHGIVFEF